MAPSTNPSHGTKVTPPNNPSSNTQESPGPIAPSSLAAESVRAGGAFAANTPGRDSSTTTTPAAAAAALASTRPSATPADDAAAPAGVPQAPTYVNAPQLARGGAAPPLPRVAGAGAGAVAEAEDEGMVGRPAAFQVEGVAGAGAAARGGAPGGGDAGRGGAFDALERQADA